MKASLISQLKGILSDQDRYKQLDPTNRELRDLIYSLGDVEVKKLYLVNVVVNFLNEQLFENDHTLWESVLLTLKVHSTLQQDLLALCTSKEDRDKVKQLTFDKRFASYYANTALASNCILLFFFGFEEEHFDIIEKIPQTSSNNFVKTLIALDRSEESENSNSTKVLLDIAKTDSTLLAKVTSEEARERYLAGSTIADVVKEKFVPRSTEYTKKLLTGASQYVTAENSKATNLDEWWESLHPFDIATYSMLKSIDTEKNKLSDKFLKDKVVPYLRAMASFDLEIFQYYRQHYEKILQEIVLEILQSNTARAYVLSDLGINLDFTTLKIDPKEHKRFVETFFSIEAILFYIKGIKFEDLISLVRRDGVIALDDDALQNFAGFVNLQIYKLIVYSNSYGLLYTLYNNTAFKSILFDENLVKILLHSAETHGNKIDLNSVLLTRGLVYNAESMNFQTVNNNFTGHAGNKLRKKIFGEDTIALIDATGYSIETLIKFALQQPQFLDILYSNKVIGYVKEGKLTREKFARVIKAKPKDVGELEAAIDHISNEQPQQPHEQVAVIEETQQPEQVEQRAEAVDDDNGHSLANSVIYNGQLITNNPLEVEQAAQPPATVVAARAPSPVPPAAQSTMIAGVSCSGTALQTGTSTSSTSSTTTLVQTTRQDKRTEQGGKGQS